MTPSVSFQFISDKTENALFSYLASKLIEVRFGHKYVAPHEFPSDSDRLEIHEHQMGEILANPPEDIGSKHVLCIGYFQQSDFFVPYRKQLLDSIYSSDDSWVWSGHRVSIREILQTPSPVLFDETDIVIHLRLDDFIQTPCPTSDIIPPQHYLRVLESKCFNFNKLYIVCDQLRYEWEKEYVRFFETWNPQMIQGSLFSDMAAMREAPTLLHSNSTLCWISSFLSVRANKQRVIPRTYFYKGQMLKTIESTDLLIDVAPMPHAQVYALKYVEYLKSFVRPFPYSIPDEYVVEKVPEKTQVDADMIPGKMETYIYRPGQEREYYEMYRRARFAITTPRGGWDTIRHYEILASGTIPIFERLDQCPPTSLTTFPKQLVAEANRALLPWSEDKEALYQEYASKILQHTREHCTTAATARRFISQLPHGVGEPKKILMFRLNEGINYTREFFWIGMKRHIEQIGGEAVEYPPIEYIYKDYPNRQFVGVHGGGFTYSDKFDSKGPVLSSEQIGQTIRDHHWDLIIYGKMGPDEGGQGTAPHLPHWETVIRSYPRERIVFLYGGDGCQNLQSMNHYGRHLLEHSKYGTCFVRELIM